MRMRWKLVLLVALALITVCVIGAVGATTTQTTPAVKVTVPLVAPAVADKEVISYDNYALYRDAAKKLEAEGKLLEASVEFIKAANQVKEFTSKGIKFQVGTPEGSEAWQLNSAALCIIKLHMKDNKTDLTKAKEWIEEAALVNNAVGVVDADRTAKIQKNSEYIEFWIGKAEVGKTVDVPKNKVEVKSVDTTKVGK